MALRNDGQLPQQVLRELVEVLRRRNPHAQPLPPQDVEVDQPLPADEQQVPAPPQPQGWGWQGYTAMYARAMATGGLFGVSVVATVHAGKKVYDWATTSKKEPEVTV